MKNCKNKKNKRVYYEQYLIRYDYLKPDGYWLRNQYMDIDVPLDENFSNEKNQHDVASSMAEEQLKKLHKKFQITQVSLC